MSTMYQNCIAKIKKIKKKSVLEDTYSTYSYIRISNNIFLTNKVT